MTAAMLRGIRRTTYRCLEPGCHYATGWLLDLWEHRLTTGHMDALR